MDKNSLEYKLFLDWWNWYKGHYAIKDTEEWWDEAIKSGSDLWANYEGTPQEEFAKDLVMVGLNECERRRNREKE